MVTVNGDHPQSFLSQSLDMLLTVRIVVHLRALTLSYQRAHRLGCFERLEGRQLLTVTTVTPDSLDVKLPMAAVGESLFFQASDEQFGTELRRLGAEGEIDLVEDISPGAADTTILRMITVGNTLYFAADRDGERELWAIREGQTAAEKLSQGSQLGSVFWFAEEANGELYFQNDFALWRSDGTASGTQQVFNLEGMQIREGVEYSGQLYFVLDLGAGQEIWSSDGTSNGTTRVMPLRKSDLLLPWKPRTLTVVGSRLFFTAESSPNNRDLWVYDGAVDTMWMLKETNRNGPDIPGEINYAHNSHFALAEYDGQLYYAANSEEGDLRLWKTFDGLPQSTNEVHHLPPQEGHVNLGSLTTVGNHLTFVAWGLDTLWRTNGENLEPVAEGVRSPVTVAVSGNRLAFVHRRSETDRTTLLKVVDVKTKQMEVAFDPATEEERLVGPVTDNPVWFGESLFFVVATPSGGRMFAYTEELPGDANVDGIVDFTDFLLLSSNFGSEGVGREAGDFTGDGAVTFEDFLILSVNFGIRRT